MIKPVVVIVLLATVALAKAQGFTPLCPGCPTVLESPADFAKATNVLKESLTQLTAGEGPNYKLGKINSGSKQVISGIFYKINANLIDENEATKTCDIEIIRAREVTITLKCEEEDEVKRVHEYIRE
ncbi:sarcocystatin-A [Stomoxys calcitrans]|uniref:Cystatin domain-containing protein n=1 Tax=Stomoxys calcitrans TaxID=35570 RepID=A0A1I8PKU5_STOCA|nr:sarcocystatin-A [Stomoxys calcitrans]